MRVRASASSDEGQHPQCAGTRGLGHARARGARGACCRAWFLLTAPRARRCCRRGGRAQWGAALQAGNTHVGQRSNQWPPALPAQHLLLCQPKMPRRPTHLLRGTPCAPRQPKGSTRLGSAAAGSTRLCAGAERSVKERSARPPGHPRTTHAAHCTGRPPRSQVATQVGQLPMASVTGVGCQHCLAEAGAEATADEWASQSVWRPKHGQQSDSAALTRWRGCDSSAQSSRHCPRSLRRAWWGCRGAPGQNGRSQERR